MSLDHLAQLGLALFGLSIGASTISGVLCGASGSSSSSSSAANGGGFSCGHWFSRADSCAFSWSYSPGNMNGRIVSSAERISAVLGGFT
jgi:hypothetical protein